MLFVVLFHIKFLGESYQANVFIINQKWYGFAFLGGRLFWRIFAIFCHVTILEIKIYICTSNFIEFG